MNSDARLSELEMLSRIERQGALSVGPLKGAERDLVAFLASRGYVNDLNIPWQHGRAVGGGLPGESELERRLQQWRLDTLSQILGGHPVVLQITHAGRVRIAELNEAFRSARIREPFGILWDGRHFEPDLRIRLLNASSDSPLVLVYMDLNGMKNMNDTQGHDAGDLVLRAYFNALSTALADRAEAYRLGGDEAGIILSTFSKEDALAVVKNVCLLFMGEHLRYRDSNLPRVSIAAGMVMTSNPSHLVPELRKSADTQMYRAKGFTKTKTPRPSSLAIEDDNDIREFQF